MTRCVSTLLLAGVLVVGVAHGRPALAGSEEDVAAGLAAAARGHWSKAADSFLRAVDADATNRDALLGLARASVHSRKKNLYDRLIDLLSTHLDKSGEDYEALIRLGEVIEADGSDPSDEYEEAHEKLDARLAKGGKPPADVLFWKGKAFFNQALWAARSSATRSSSSALLRKAQGMLDASTVADPASFKTAWLNARISMYLKDYAAAAGAYFKAAKLRPDLLGPLQGVSLLLRTQKPERYEAMLLELIRLNQKHPQAHYFLGLHRLESGRFDEAKELLVKATSLDPSNADALHSLGMAEALTGDEEKAIALFKRALKADPEHEQAAAQIDKRLRSARIERRVLRKPEAALAAAKSYEELLALAPTNPLIRNNLAYLLRKAWRQHTSDPAWRPVLDECVKQYEAATRIIGPWNEATALSSFTDERAANPAYMRLWRRNYAYAQILSDTGGIYQEARDLTDAAKSEALWLRCMDYSGYAYYDGWGFLRRLYERKARWADLAALAKRCVGTLRGEDGKPHADGRRQAADVLAKLEKDGRIKDD